MLTKLKDYFKHEYGWQHSVSIGRIDKTQQKALCFYNSKHSSPKTTAIGGNANKSYTLLPVTLLLRYTNSPVEAAQKAWELYCFFDEKRFLINSQEVFCIPRYAFPIDVGSDEGGICEYTIELDFYFNKE